MAVLIVDHDTDTRETLARILATARIEVTLADTGQQGLRLARRHHPALLMTALHLPDMNGLALLRALRGDGYDLPVVIMTAFPSAASAVEAMKLGAADYIEKPIEVDDVLRNVAPAHHPGDRPSSATIGHHGPSTTAGLDVPQTNFRIQQVSEILHLRSHEPGLTLGAVAREVGVTREHLCRLLKRSTGMGFTAHVRSTRVAAAQQLLQATTLSVKEIAFRVGFTSISRFDHDFKLLCGVPPTVYRRTAASARHARGQSASARAHPQAAGVHGPFRSR